MFLVSEILLAEERGGWFTLGVMIDILVEEGAASHIIDMVWPPFAYPNRKEGGVLIIHMKILPLRGGGGSQHPVGVPL